MKPEEQARQKIDDLLTQAGWAVQDSDRFNLGAKRGVAVREFSMSTGATDYLLFVDREAVGTIEAKKVGETLIGVEEQSAKYRMGLPGGLPAARIPLPFTYETTGIETRFTISRRKAPGFIHEDESRSATRRQNTRHLFYPLLYCMQFFCT